mmetsp:Transcript_77234/g.166993  ORF Transcript_77234/g.166993 Transcript_77234/m.166993 type:complete len:129 (-) Transcript_77234:584-970(-)
MMNSKLNANVVKEQVILEERKKKLEAQINSNQDKQILKIAIDDMWADKKKEDLKREKKVKVAQETIQTNKQQQKELKLLAKKEKEEEAKIAEWNKQREKKQEEFKLKIEKKKKEAQVIRQKMIDRQAE